MAVGVGAPHSPSGGVGLPAGRAQVGPPPAAGGHGSPHAPAPAQGTAGHWIQQGGQWTLIHAIGPGQWAKGPKPGYASPPKPKITGGISDVQRAAGPNPGHAQAAAARSNPSAQASSWLTPLTPQQVRTEATNMISSIYAPENAALDSEASQEQAILAKQSADNQYYMQWLDTKSTALQAQQSQVNDATNALESQITSSMNSAMGAQPGQLTASANAQPGNVTNNAPAFESGTPLGNALAANEQSSEQIVGAAANRALTQEQIAQGQLTAGAQNDAAYLEAGALRQQGLGQAAMTKIATEKASALSREATSLASEITRLNTLQISLSENNRNYDTAAAKLGIQVANTNSEIAARNAATKIRQATLGLDLAKFKNTVAEQSIKNNLAQQGLNLRNKSEQLAAQRLILQTANVNSEMALRNAEIYAKQHGALTPHEANTYYDIIDKATGEINGLIQRGATPQEAYQYVLNGRGKFGSKTAAVPRLSNQSMLNAAYNLREGGPGLNAGDIAYLQRLGLTDVSTRYAGRIAPPASTPNNNKSGLGRK